MDLLVIKNITASELGTVAEVGTRRGARFTLNDAQQGDVPPADDAGFDGLLVMGGPMNADEDHLHPHLPEAARLIRRFHEADKPVMGICLGAQLTARAFGRKVHRHGAHEKGFHKLATTEAGRTDPLFAGLGPEEHLFQWHEDTFDLPEGAELLLTGSTCKHQAFRLGRATYGFQCHIEVTPEVFGVWAVAAAEHIKKTDPTFLARVAEQMPVHMPGSRRFAHTVVDRWMDLVAARKAKAA
jgi:GMP synthase (glutamine-hydrolysing)